MSALGETTRAVLAAVATLGLTGAAVADGWGGGSVKDAPAEGRKLDLSFTLTGTSDYIFRGISQSSEDPAVQGAVDLTYGILYAGIWASNVDFDDAPKATAELNLYTGLKPVWGPVTFDFGVIYYAYPGADDSGGDLDYVELKAGYSLVSPWIKGLTSGTTLYWSPDNTGETGEVFTVESAAAYALPQVGIFTPTLSGVYGTVYGDSGDGFAVGVNNDDEYTYWSAGLELAVEKFTFDFRYWDTDIKGWGTADERFVFTASVTLP